MKTRTNYLLALILVLSFCLTNCGKSEEIGIEEQVEEVGFLSLKTQLEKEINVTTGKRGATLDDILDNIYVEIYQTDAFGFRVLIFSSNYRDLPEMIPLMSGSYGIQMYSDGILGNPYTSRFDYGDYGWEGFFSITVGTNTEVSATLNLLDTAVTIDYTDALLSEYPDIIVDAGITYSLTELPTNKFWTASEDNRTAYFNMFDVLVESAGYNIIPFSENLDITITAGLIAVYRTYGVYPNEHYKITVSYSGGSASIMVTLDDEVIIEDEIPFPG